MNEEELNIYLNKMELKIKKKIKEENEYYENSISTNLGDLENSHSSLKNEKKDTTFIRKRNRTISENLDNNNEKEKNSLLKIINYEEEEEKQEANNMMDLDENNKNTVNNEISTNENNEFKFGFEQDINNKNNENINDKKEEEKKDNNDNKNNLYETNVNDKNSNAFDIKFTDFLPPYDDQFLEKGLNYNLDFNENFLIFDNNEFGLYNKSNIDYIDEKKDLYLYDKNINLFED